MSDGFITYAHRGASTYCPENTMLSFYTGVYMGANGIETDVQVTKDGVLVLFHDDTLDRILGIEGAVKDYTYEELLQYKVKNGSLFDRVPTFEEFLDHFVQYDLTFAIELKVTGIEREVADMIYKYGAEKKVIVTSFIFEAIETMRACAPELEIGYLVTLYRSKLTDEENEARVKTIFEQLERVRAEEICPRGTDVTPERVRMWHDMGYRVRAWGISDTDIMKRVYDAGVEGMTVNFPDKLLEYINSKV